MELECLGRDIPPPDVAWNNVETSMDGGLSSKMETRKRPDETTGAAQGASQHSLMLAVSGWLVQGQHRHDDQTRTMKGMLMLISFPRGQETK